jgi:hypothetical protein
VPSPAVDRKYVEDRLTTDGLGERVAIAHRADTLDELDGALRDL